MGGPCEGELVRYGKTLGSGVTIHEASYFACRYQNTTPLKAGMVVSNEPGTAALRWWHTRPLEPLKLSYGLSEGLQLQKALAELSITDCSGEPEPRHTHHT